MKRFALFFAGIILIYSNVSHAQITAERINRGAIAAKKNMGYFISWRLLGSEDYQTGFNIYRNNDLLNVIPIENSTSYYDSIANENDEYFIAAVENGMESPLKFQARKLEENEGQNSAYFDIPIKKPSRGINGGIYSANDASTGDLNGDGAYDIVLKWDPSNSKDNSKGGITDNVYLDGYTLDGEQLWRIDLGPNIRAGAHYTQFLVFDFDGNGKAEIMCKTAPGTRDGLGNYLQKGPAAKALHNKIYRNSDGYVLTGPEYITVFDGETGEELATATYWPLRASVSSWGDKYGNRVDRFNATVAYIDGENPSAVFQRGYYSRLTMAAWNWRNNKLERVWTFDSDETGNSAYYGQGNHSIHVIDANGDGLQDIVTGSSVISGTGMGLHTSGMGHGDACHVSYMKKDDPRPMIYMSHESGGNGVSLRYADNGEIIFNNRKDKDIGRSCAAELDSENPGFKFWAASGMGLYDMDGNVVGSVPSAINFVIWWDGNLSRDLMDGIKIDQWSVTNNKATNLLTASGTSSNNGTKATPCLQADILGDWREELILRLSSSNALRVYTSTMPTNYKMYTLMHDPVYRVNVSSQNSSYNQPPHPGFYLASDMNFPPPSPQIKYTASIYRGSGDVIKDLLVYRQASAEQWQIESSFNHQTAVHFNETTVLIDIPEQYFGNELIVTPSAMDSTTSTDTIASFRLKEDAIVSVFYSNEVTTIPDWLKDYTKKEELIEVIANGNASQTMCIYEKEFTDNELVVLGTNSSIPNIPMYFVVVQGLNQDNSIQALNNGQEFKVYPTDNSSILNIEYQNDYPKPISICLYDYCGKLIKSEDVLSHNSGQKSTRIDINNFPSGIYLLRLQSNDFTVHKRIHITN